MLHGPYRTRTSESDKYISKKFLYADSWLNRVWNVCGTSPEQQQSESQELRERDEGNGIKSYLNISSRNNARAVAFMAWLIEWFLCSSPSSCVMGGGEW